MHPKFLSDSKFCWTGENNLWRSKIPLQAMKLWSNQRGLSYWTQNSSTWRSLPLCIILFWSHYKGKSCWTTKGRLWRSQIPMQAIWKIWLNLKGQFMKWCITLVVWKNYKKKSYFIVREGVKNIQWGGPSILGGYWPYSLFFGENRPFLVCLGKVESNSGIFRGGESFLFTFRGVMMKLT